MPRAAQHALLHHPRIRPHLEHIQIVIGLQHQAISPAKMDLDEFRHVAKIGDDRHLRAVRTEREPDRVRRVVRNRESVHLNIPNGKMLPRLNRFHAVEPLAKRFRQDPLHRSQRGLGNVKRRFPHPKHLRQAVAVVGVFVGDQDSVDVLDGSFDSREARQRFALAKTGIHQKAGPLGLEQCDVARAARRQDGYPQADRVLLNLSAPFRFETNFQNDGRAPRVRQ